MSGLYVHIPFCARRCPYCDFAIQIGGGPPLVERYVAALAEELHSTLSEGGRQAPVETVFFGGGTPTLLSSAQLAALMAAIDENADLADGAEVSIEANPELLDEAKLRGLRAAGFNRLSLGAQSFDDAILKRLGRKHSSVQIEAAVAAARDAGFANVSLDLIYAVPGQTLETWRATLEQAIALEVTHISCYSLTIEPGTPFARQVARGQLEPEPDDSQAAVMDTADVLLNEAGYGRYEISNYARPGYNCRHNENYWRCGDYFGCGNGAHGHRAGHRWWNERATTTYVAAIESGTSPRAGQEHLTPRQRLDEIVLLGLRTKAGFAWSEADALYGGDARHELHAAFVKLHDEGWLLEASGRVLLAPRAMRVADAIAAQLLG